MLFEDLWVSCQYGGQIQSQQQFYCTNMKDMSQYIFLKLWRKHCAIQSHIYSVTINQDEITDQAKTNKDSLLGEGGWYCLFYCYYYFIIAIFPCACFENGNARGEYQFLYAMRQNDTNNMTPPTPTIFFIFSFLTT